MAAQAGTAALSTVWRGASYGVQVKRKIGWWRWDWAKFRGRGARAASIGVIAAGAALVALATAGASGGNKLYVATTGSDTSNTCTVATSPCLTIGHALSEAASGSKIEEAAAGNYAEQLVIDKSVKIIGSANKSNPTVIEPLSLPTSDTDTDSSQPQYAIVDVTSGAKAKLTNLIINGDMTESQFNGCGNDFVGVYTTTTPRAL